VGGCAKYLFMKKITFVIAVTLLSLLPTRSMGQEREFFFGLTYEGSNFWANIPAFPVECINGLLGGGAVGTSYDWVSVKDSQGKLDVDNGSYFGFKARDLFNHFGYGLTFGYQPMYSVFGAYVRGGYNFRQFRMQPDRSLDGKEKYKLNSWTAGVGIRLTPFKEMLEDNSWSPIVEVGTDYHKVFSAKAPYDNNTDQFGSGFSTHFAVGVRYVNYADESYTISLSFELPHYDYFNRDFTLSTGEKPYADIKSKNYGISLRLQKEF